MLKVTNYVKFDLVLFLLEVQEDKCRAAKFAPKKCHGELNSKVSFAVCVNHIIDLQNIITRKRRFTK